MSVKIEWKGRDKLLAKLDKNIAMEAVKQIVKANGAELTEKMVNNAVFTKGYSTGATRRSIPPNSGIRDGGLTAYSGPGTHYAPYVEYGTRKMEAQPFVRPAFNAQKDKFIADMDRLVN